MRSRRRRRQRQRHPNVGGGAHTQLKYTKNTRLLLAMWQSCVRRVHTRTCATVNMFHIKCTLITQRPASANRRANTHTETARGARRSCVLILPFFMHFARPESQMCRLSLDVSAADKRCAMSFRRADTHTRCTINLCQYY